MDAIKETIQKAGHRVEEAVTGAHHATQQTGDHIKETVMGGQHSTESAATRASHAAQENIQGAGHRGEEVTEKVKHRAGMHS